MNGTVPTLVLAGSYLLLGAGLGVVLVVRGHGAGTAAAALVAWPLLLGLLLPSPERPGASVGPCAERIDRTFDGLLATLDDPASEAVPWGEQAEALRAALHRADARVAFVDRVLEDTDGVDADTVATLVEARRHAVTEIDAVLSAVSRLRLQVGLLALAGEADPVHEQLGHLLQRADALLEVHRAGYPSGAAASESRP